MTDLNISGYLSFAVPILLAGYSLYMILHYGSREKHLPPGPPTLPIIGNAHLLASGKADLSTIKPASSGSEAGWMGDFGVVSLDGWIDWLRRPGWLDGLIGLILN
jgi:hypothetical protein